MFVPSYRPALVRAIADETGLSPEECDALLEVPPTPELGHIAFPCFRLAKSLRRPPAAIASELAARMALPEGIERVRADGAYLNFFLEVPRHNDEVVGAVLAAGERFGDWEVGAGKTVVIDFSSPNIAKPFTLGHLRSTVLGAALARLYEAMGYRVVRLNHLGDWGTQFGNLIAAYERWGDERALQERPIAHLLELYVRFHKEAQADPALAEEGREWFRRLERGDGRARSLWARFRGESLREFAKVYDLLGVHFDACPGESYYVEHPEWAQEVLSALEERGLLVESQGALVVPLDEYDMPPCIVRKSDEASIYATRDLAAALHRMRTYEPELIIYTTDARQKLHFRQVFKVLELAGFDWAERLVHVDFGLIRFGGETLATREGKVVLLEDVLGKAVELTRRIIEEKNPDLPGKEEVARAVGVGAVVFADLVASRVKDTDYTWEDILSFDGRTGPYCQYAHVRAAGILRTYGKPVPRSARPLLTLPEEFDLCRRLAELPWAIRRSAERFEPSILANWLLDAAESFNNYYHHHRIVSVDNTPELTEARVRLVAALRIGFAKALSLLGLAAPERM